LYTVVGSVSVEREVLVLTMVVWAVSTVNVVDTKVE
jgi:hypothetical protein